ENDGAPGIDGVTFEAIEAQGVDGFLEQIRDELVRRTYKPLPARRQEIPKDGGKVRVLSIPAIRDRVVQGALKLILEPIFEADFQPGSFGYRPKKTAHEAVDRVAKAIVQLKTRVIDFDLRSYFDNIRHDRLLAKVAQRVEDDDVMHLLKIMLKANGRHGVPQGGVVSPLLHGALEPEQEAIIEEGWMIDAICIADQRVGEAAEVDEAVPIGVVARQARDLESEHEADVGECDFGGEAGEARSRNKAGTGEPEILIDDDDAITRPAKFTGFG